MDRRERVGDEQATLLAVLDGFQADVWTALPGIIESFDPVKKTCVVQPAIQAQVQAPDNSLKWATMPRCLDVLVQFPSGGGVTLTFPIKEGDECLLIFASRCIDEWWQNGGVQRQAELRMHSLSDGFCIPGVSSIPKVPESISTDSAELRSIEDPEVRVRLKPSTKEVSIETTGASVKVSPNRVDIDGELFINGDRYLDHEHTGVTTGGADTGGVA